MGTVTFTEFEHYEHGNFVRAIAAPLIIDIYDEKPYLEWQYGFFNKQHARIYYKDIVDISYFKGGIVRDAYFAISTHGATYHAKLIGDFQNLDELAAGLENCREIQRQEVPREVNNTSVSAADEIMKYKNLLDMGVITQAEFNAKKKQLLGL